MFGDEPLDGTSRPAYPHAKEKRIYASLFCLALDNVRFFLQPGNSAQRFSAAGYVASLLPGESATSNESHVSIHSAVRKALRLD